MKVNTENNYPQIPPMIKPTYLKKLCEEIAKIQNRVLLELYIDLDGVKSEDCENIEHDFLKYMQEFKHENLIKQTIQNNESHILLNDPDCIPGILKDVSEQFKHSFYNVYLNDIKGNPIGRAWNLYSFMERLNLIDAFTNFLQEIVCRREMTQEIKYKAYTWLFGPGHIYLLEAREFELANNWTSLMKSFKEEKGVNP